MKKLLFITVLCVLCFTPIQSSGDVMIPHTEFSMQPSPPEGYQQVLEFLDELAFLESSGRYDARRGQYWGRYQLGDAARADLGLDVSFSEFSLNSTLQDISVLRYFLINETYLRSTLRSYEGSEIKGITLTKEALLAGAHLVGHADLKAFLKSEGEYIPEDGNSVPVTAYLARFQKYEGLNLLETKKYLLSKYEEG